MSTRIVQYCCCCTYIVVAHIPVSLLNFEGVACRIFLPLSQTHQNLGGKAIKSTTEIQSSAIIVHEAKRTATSTRTTQTRQNNPYRLGAAPAGVVGARSRCCPAATVPASVVFACQETCGPHGRAYEFRQDRQPWKIIHDEG